MILLVTAGQCAVILLFLWFLWSDKARDGDRWWKRRISRRGQKGAIAAISSTLLSAAALMVSLNVFWYREMRVSEEARGIIDSMTLETDEDDAIPRIRLDVSFLNMGNRAYAVNDVYMDLVVDYSDSLVIVRSAPFDASSPDSREFMVTGGAGLAINAEHPGENSVRLVREGSFRPILLQPGQIARETYIFGRPLLTILERSFVPGSPVEVQLSCSCIASSGRVFDTRVLVGKIQLTERQMELACEKRSPHVIDLMAASNLVTSRMRLATSWLRPSASDTIWLPTSDSTGVFLRMSRRSDGLSGGMIVHKYFDD